MRKIFIIFFIVVFTLFIRREVVLAQANSPIIPNKNPADSNKAPNQIVVIFKGKPAVKVLLNFSSQNTGVTPSYGISSGNSMVYAVKDGSLKDTLEKIRQDPNVKSAFPDYKMRFLALTNDPGIMATPEPGKPRMQWGIFNLKAAGEAASAWDKSQGSEHVVVAVVDSGVDSSHQDLSGKFSSLVDCVGGCKEVSSMTDHPLVPHGTHVTGIIAAATNNNLGIAGVGYNTKIMMLKVMGVGGDMAISDVINAIKWAADHNDSQKVKVINLSLGQYEENLDAEAINAMTEAVSYAWNKGIVVVAAAGNCGTNTNGREDCAILDADGKTTGYVSNSKSYPGAIANAISVAALKVDNSLPAYSQRNNAGNAKIGNWVTVAAPGGDCSSEADSYNCILSTFYSPSGRFGYMAGTSQATPHVAGVAALVFAANPSLSNSQVRNIIETTADKSVSVGATNNGAVDALAAVSKALENVTPSPTGEVPSVSPSPDISITPTGFEGTPSATPIGTPSATPISTPSATLIPEPTLIPSPTLYPTMAPKLPKTPPEPYPMGPYCPRQAGCNKKEIGDANCDGFIDKADYKILLEQFDTMASPEPVNQNANFSCIEGQPSSYFVDMVDYEIWRRYAGVIPGGISPVPLKK